jgi:hypothetical protein
LVDKVFKAGNGLSKANTRKGRKEGRKDFGFSLRQFYNAVWRFHRQILNGSGGSVIREIRLAIVRTFSSSFLKSPQGLSQRTLRWNSLHFMASRAFRRI